MIWKIKLWRNNVIIFGLDEIIWEWKSDTETLVKNLCMDCLDIKDKLKMLLELVLRIIIDLCII